MAAPPTPLDVITMPQTCSSCVGSPSAAAFRNLACNPVANSLLLCFPQQMADIVVTANIVTVLNVFLIAKDAVTDVAAARIPAFPLSPLLCLSPPITFVLALSFFQSLPPKPHEPQQICGHSRYACYHEDREDGQGSARQVVSAALNIFVTKTVGNTSLFLLRPRKRLWK